VEHAGTPKIVYVTAFAAQQAQILDALDGPAYPGAACGAPAVFGHLWFGKRLEKARNFAKRRV
jgi:hypothetical protein